MISAPARAAAHAALHARSSCRPALDLGASWRLADGTPVMLRPVMARDGAALARFIATLTPESREARYRVADHGLNAAQIAALADVDADSEIACVITVPDEGGERIIGEIRFVIDGNTGEADIALVVADAWQRHGIGTSALVAMAKAAAQRGLRWLRADVCAANDAMLGLLRRCGFTGHAVEHGRAHLQLLLLPPFPGC